MIALFDIIFQLINWALMISILLTWIPHDPHHPAIQWLHRFTEPIFEPFRRLIPPFAGIDLSPIVAFMAIQFVRDLLFQFLF